MNFLAGKECGPPTAASVSSDGSLRAAALVLATRVHVHIHVYACLHANVHPGGVLLACACWLLWLQAGGAVDAAGLAPLAGLRELALL